MEQYKKDFIDLAVAQNVLRFGDFTLKSGRKSPYFFNAGDFKTGEAISKLATAYASAIHSNVDGFDDVVLFGPAYKGIPIAAAVSAKLYELYGVSVPFAYNRKEAKDHGEGGTLVGAKITESSRVIVTEDVITAGTAVKETAAILAGVSAKIESVFVLLDRMEQRDVDATIYSIVNIKEVMEYLDLDEENRKRMEAYLAEYSKTN
jgi:orotate phosphoribosyltransferase